MPQFLHGPNGERTFAVLTIEEYLRLNPDAEAEEEAVAGPSLLHADGFTITMPNGGPGQTFDVRQLVCAMMRRGTTGMAVNGVMAINARKQAYHAFNVNTMNTLDPILRRCFLPPDSPYRNTLQATVRLVDALIETGVFTRAMVSGPGFYRPVQGIRLDEEQAVAFCHKYGLPANHIDQDLFMLNSRSPAA